MTSRLLPALRAACRYQKALSSGDFCGKKLHAGPAQVLGISTRSGCVLSNSGFYSQVGHQHGESSLLVPATSVLPPSLAAQCTGTQCQNFISRNASMAGLVARDTEKNYARHMVNPWRTILGGSNEFTSQALSEEVRMERLEGTDTGIVVISLNRPERKNAIGKVFLRQLQDAIEEIEADLSVRAVIVRSEVGGVFCAGADLKERRSQTSAEVQKFVQNLRGTFADLEALPVPSIAAVEGKALGGGCELALACDLRVAGEEAAFALPETGLAIIPGAGATQRLPRVIGKARAKELILTGTQVSAEKAERIGLANHCVPAGEAYSKALELGRQILTRGPIAIRMAKAAIDRGYEVDLTTGLAIEEACYAILLPSKDRLEALEAFKEKRKPVYKGE